MIKVKDGYAKLIGTTYQGSPIHVLLSDGGYLEYSKVNKENTLVLRDENKNVYATYYSSEIVDEDLIDIGSIYVRNISDNLIRRIEKTKFYDLIDEKFVTLDTNQVIVGAKVFTQKIKIDLSGTNETVVGKQSAFLTLKHKSQGLTYETPIISAIISNETTNAYNGDYRVGSTSGATWISAGESGGTLSNTLPIYNNESVWITTDADVKFYTGCNNEGTLYTHSATINPSGIHTQLQFHSSIPTGTRPIDVVSTTLCTNLNADMLDGWHLDNIRKDVGYSWVARYRINNWSRILKIDSYSNVLLSINFSQNSQASNHLYLVSTGYSSANIIQLGANNFGGNSGVRIRLTENSSTSHNVEIYSTYGYNGATEINITCNYTKVDGTSTLTTYSSYTAGGGTVKKEITSSSNKIVANLQGNSDTATKLHTARTINGTSFDGTANIVTAYWGTARTISLSGAVTGSASVNGSQNVTITTTYQFGSIDGRYVGGNKTANHGSSGTAYTADTYSSTFVNKAFVAFAERGSWAYANNGYVSTDTGVNIPLAGTAIFQWGASDTSKTQLYITPHNNSGVSNPAANEMLFYTSNGSGYTSAWTRVLTHRNYTNYTVTKTGGGASGTWEISITGNAVTANRLKSSGNKSAISGTTLGDSGLRLYQVYSNGYPATYGNLLNIGGIGYGELLCEWKGDTSPGHLYYRSKRDIAETAWSQWVTVLDSSNYSSLIGNNYWKVNKQTTTGTGDIYLEMWRGTNASWKILNSGGNLYLQSNYTTTTGNYFNVLTLQYNSGNAILKGMLTANSHFVNTGDATLKIYSGRTVDAKNDGCIAFQTSIDGTDGQSHAYPTQWGDRCTIALQPRGGQVMIGAAPSDLNTGHKLYVQGGSRINGVLTVSSSTFNKQFVLESHSSTAKNQGAGIWFRAATDRARELVLRHEWYDTFTPGYGLAISRHDSLEAGDSNMFLYNTGRYISKVPTGTKPIDVVSTTLCNNLNADLLDGYHANSFVKIVGARFSQYQQGTYTKILEFTITSGSLQPSITFTWHPSECARDVWADFSINIRSSTITFYANWKGAGKRNLWCVGDGTTYSVWVSGTKSSWDPYGIVQIVSTWGINTYKVGSLQYADTAPSGTYSATAITSGWASRVVGTLTMATGRFSSKTYNGGADVTVNIPTHTSHLTNDSGFWTGTRYWANIAVSTSSSTSTSPTFSTAYTSNWFRSTGSTGWYSQTYGGGWYMSDSTWIRTFGSKSVYQDTGQIRTDGYLVTKGGLTAGATSPNNETYKLHVTGASWSSGLIRAGGGFYHNSVNSNSYVLLAGGSYKGLGDFAKGNAGSATKGVYVTGGTVTAMTYSLSSNLNSGTSGKLAYYSSATTVAAYSSSVGSSAQPIYLNAGSLSASSYSFTGTYSNPVIVWCGEIYRSTPGSTYWYSVKKGGCCSISFTTNNAGSNGNLIISIPHCEPYAAFCSTVRIFDGSTAISAGDGTITGRSAGMGDYMTICGVSGTTGNVYIRKFSQQDVNNDAWRNGELGTTTTSNGNKPVARFYLMIVGRYI